MNGPGGYREYPPPADLVAHVACTWASVARGSERAAPIIPDGCSDIIVLGDAEPHVAGPASITQWIPAPAAGARIVAIRLRPGAARAVFGCPADRLLNTDAPLAAICGRAARTLGRALAASDLPLHRRHALEAWVRARVEAAGGADDWGLHAAARILAAPGLTVDDLAFELGWSPRRAHRELVAAAGYGPKRLQRIMRIQRVLRLRAAAGAPLADLAYAAGFADQAHMTRDFREITGFTPSAYLAGANLAVGAWLEPADSFKT